MIVILSDKEKEHMDGLDLNCREIHIREFNVTMTAEDGPFKEVTITGVLGSKKSAEEVFADQLG